MPPPTVDPDAMSYRVEVMVHEAGDDRIKPLSGVNKGVLTYPKYGLTGDGNQTKPSVICDLTHLYQAAGVTSVRTHDDVFDVGNIFRVEGTFSAGVDFRSDFQPPLALQELIDDWLGVFLRRNDGYVFSVGSFKEFLVDSQLVPVDDPLLGEFEEYDAWLYWQPLDDLVVDDPSNYLFGANTTGAKAAYNALAAGDFEVYFRAGESFNGPTYFMPSPLVGPGGSGIRKRRYARALDRILDELRLVPGQLEVLPGFIEVWNEPAAIGYHGPRAKWDGSDPTWAGWSEDFKELADAIYDAVKWAAPIGGFGFNRAQLKKFVGSMATGHASKSTAVLRQTDMATFPFVSFHWYRDLEEPVAHPLLETLRFPRDLVALREALDSLSDAQALPIPIDGLPIETTSPPLHITEWNFLANPDKTHGFPGGASVFG